MQSTVSAHDPEYDPAKVKVLPKIHLKAQPFGLTDVRLLAGPFKHAQDLDHQYLLSLDPDRLLYNFRVNAGLPTAAQPLGGWEAPDCELRGHFVGHYLSACAKMYASTGDETLKHRAREIVAGMAQCQQAMHSGYLSAFPESFIDRVAARQPVWAPWYTIHKIFAGLIDTYLYCGDRQALEVASKMLGWARQRSQRLTDDSWQAMLNNEHGGMNEALANLYAITGDPDALSLSLRFNHRAVLDPLSREEDHLTGLHANTQIPKVIGAARQYELTGDETLRTTAAFFWQTVTRDRSYVIGGNSDAEHFSPKETLSEALGPNTTETCNTYNMLKLTRHLFLWDADVRYADFYERALYNHILASQNPETGMMCYYVPLRPGSRKTFNTPTDSFWCCTGTGVENHSQYGDSIYFHDGAASLYVNLFIASELSWSENGVHLRQETGFPERGETRLTITCKKPTHFRMLIRHPAWAGRKFAVRVNGKDMAPSSVPESYAVVDRTWNSGDRVEVNLPMTLHTEAFHDNPRRLAFLDGPIVLCAPVQSRKKVPAIVSADGGAVLAVHPIPGRPLHFEGSPDEFRVTGGGSAVTLSPFYQMYEGPYTVYWDELTPSEWNQREMTAREEEARQQEIEARTIDSVKPGDRAGEEAHHLQMERSASGDFGDRAWRDARDGGWFSYQLKVTPGIPQELLCTYWGGDRGRVFEVLIDGQKIATQTLDSPHRDRFFDVAYPLTPAPGQSAVTVRFQAYLRGMAGGIFGLRVVKK